MSLKNCKSSLYTDHPGAHTLSAAAFPSSEAFDAINEALTASDADRKDAVKQGNAVFAFTLKNKAGETESWHIDLKNKGEVGKGLGEKPTGRLLPAIQSVGVERAQGIQSHCFDDG
jgi:SCP-2 sterol transfer family